MAVERDRGRVPLDGLNFSVYVNWPGAIHEGKGEGLILVDERADDRQRAAVATLMRGEAGGPWAVLAWTWPKVHGPVAVPYEITFNGLSSRLKAGSAVELEFATIKNPVTAPRSIPASSCPNGSSSNRRISAARGLPLSARDRDGPLRQITAIGPFEYAFP